MLRANNHEDRIALGKAAGVSITPADACICRVVDDVLLGGFLYTNFTGKGGSIWGHVAAFERNWLTRKFVEAAFTYPFHQLGCRVVFTKIAEDNTKSLDFCEKLGFNRFGLLPDVYPDGRGQQILRMYIHECRWLPPSHTVGTVH